MTKEGPIGESQVIDLVERNWYITVDSVAYIPAGVSTHNWLVAGADGQHIFRDGGAFSDYVRFQCDVYAALGEGDFPYEIPRPILSSHGQHVVNEGDSHYALYPYIYGDTMNNSSSLNGQRVGNMLAAYHSGVARIDYSDYRQLRSKE